MTDRLYLFYPQNDVALAANLPNFTAPKAAVDLQRSGELLPLWMCDRGDRVMCNGVNADWFDRMRSSFGLEGDVWDHHDFSLSPMPWGWSAASRSVFLHNGFDGAQLPSDSQLETWRRLSHRRTAALITEEVARRIDFPIYPPAREFSDLDSLVRYVVDNAPLVVKSPWSSSGRGVRIVRTNDDLRGIDGIIRKQGSVLAEQYVEPHFDFALLYNVHGGKAVFEGHSVFSAAGGTYKGNVVDSDSCLRSEIASKIAGENKGHDKTNDLRDMTEAIARSIETVIGPKYDGPVGIDMLCDSEGKMHIVELNLRLTMGFVAQSLSRIVSSRGVMRVVPADLSARYDQDVEGGRLARGVLPLTPPGTAFSFILEIIGKK